MNSFCRNQPDQYYHSDELQKVVEEYPDFHSRNFVKRDKNKIGKETFAIVINDYGILYDNKIYRDRDWMKLTVEVFAINNPEAKVSYG